VDRAHVGTIGIAPEVGVGRRQTTGDQVTRVDDVASTSGSPAAMNTFHSKRVAVASSPASAISMMWPDRLSGVDSRHSRRWRSCVAQKPSSLPAAILALGAGNVDAASDVAWFDVLRAVHGRGA
jgi:hypothetical protein